MKLETAWPTWCPGMGPPWRGPRGTWGGRWQRRSGWSRRPSWLGGKEFVGMGILIKWARSFERNLSGPVVFLKYFKIWALIFKIAHKKSSRADLIISNSYKKRALKRTRSKDRLKKGTNFSTHFSERTPWEERSKWVKVDREKKSGRQVS